MSDDIRLVAKRYACFDGMTWPLPDPELARCLRYYPHEMKRESQLFLASLIGAYETLIKLPQRERNARVKRLREALDLAAESEWSTSPVAPSPAPGAGK